MGSSFGDIFKRIEVKVDSILYLDLSRRTLLLTRFLHNQDKWGELLFPPYEMPLHQLFLLNEDYLIETGRFSFQFYAADEQRLQQPYIEELRLRLAQHEEELRNKREREIQQKSPPFSPESADTSQYR